jgi:FtsZ-binding cell division protein ZapB
MKTVDQHSTKAQEVQHLHDIASTCKPGSYLAVLFTPLLIAHVENAIRNDTTPDIQGDLVAEIMHGITKDTEHLREIVNLKYENRKLNDRTYSLETDVQRARETTRHYQQEAESLRNQWSELVHERAELLGTIARLTRELETLKAQDEAVQI